MSASPTLAAPRPATPARPSTTRWRPCAAPSAPCSADAVSLGYYYQDWPPKRPGWLARHTPGPVRRFLSDTHEVVVITQAVFGLLLPVLGVILAFIGVFIVLIGLLSVGTR